MTARLATHPHVAGRTGDVLTRLDRAGVDVELVGPSSDPEPLATPEIGAVAELGAAVADERFDPLQALRDSTIDLALVGIRALRGAAAEGLATVAVLPRLEVRDVVVGVGGRGRPLESLDAGARVGLVGERRAAFLAAHRPDVVPVRLRPEELFGAATDEGADARDRLDALVVSALDARQLEMAGATVEGLEPKAWMPEPGQGALALVARHPIAEATALDHLPTRTALRTELALLDALEAPDDAPLGCLAQPSGRWIRLWAMAASPDGERLVRSDLTGPLDEPEALGAAVAQQLADRGFELVAGVADRL